MNSKRKMFDQFMKKILILMLIMFSGSCYTRGEQKIREKIPQNIKYNTDLLKLLLVRAPNDRTLCTYVMNETSFWPIETYSNKKILELGMILDQHLSIPEYSITSLLLELFLLNRFSTVIDFESQRELGYRIFTSNPHSEEPETTVDRWQKFFENYPDADGGITYASIPVIDKQKGIVVWYKLQIGGPLAGQGWILIYEKEQDGTLKELIKWTAIQM